MMVSIVHETDDMLPFSICPRGPNSGVHFTATLYFERSQNVGKSIHDRFTATCQQSGVNPWFWLKNTLTRLPTTPADQLATLIPVPPQ